MVKYEVDVFPGDTIGIRCTFWDEMTRKFGMKFTRVYLTCHSHRIIPSPTVGCYFIWALMVLSQIILVPKIFLNLKVTSATHGNISSVTEQTNVMHQNLEPELVLVCPLDLQKVRNNYDLWGATDVERGQSDSAIMRHVAHSKPVWKKQVVT